MATQPKVAAPAVACSPIGRAKIEAREGVVLSAYRDSVGVWTIGVGHTSAAGDPHVYPGMRITRSQADVILSNDLRPIETLIAKVVRVPLSQREVDALCSFILNIGGGAFKSSTMLRKLNAGDRKGAADAMLAWNKAGGRTITGLTNRRFDERAQFLGTMVAPRFIGSDSDDVAHAVDNPDPIPTRLVNRAALLSSQGADMNLTSEQFQQYVRVALYWVFGALASHGVSVGDSYKQLAVAIIGTLATLAWTLYGTRLNALLAQVAKSPDVQEIKTTPAVANAVPSEKVVPAGNG
ncbi:MAG: lysozyme [Armatimonadetes bacterium]|nr:lysozyme [Armatimonadota bacterium]